MWEKMINSFKNWNDNMVWMWKKICVKSVIVIIYVKGNS